MGTFEPEEHSSRRVETLINAAVLEDFPPSDITASVEFTQAREEYDFIWLDYSLIYTFVSITLSAATIKCI